MINEIWMNNLKLLRGAINEDKVPVQLWVLVKFWDRNLRIAHISEMFFHRYFMHCRNWFTFFWTLCPRELFMAMRYSKKVFLTLQTSPLNAFVWTSYALLVTTVLIIIKVLNHRLHHMFDTSEVIEEPTEADVKSDKGSSRKSSTCDRSPTQGWVSSLVFTFPGDVAPQVNVGQVKFLKLTFEFFSVKWIFTKILLDPLNRIAPLSNQQRLTDFFLSKCSQNFLVYRIRTCLVKSPTRAFSFKKPV